MATTTKQSSQQPFSSPKTCASEQKENTITGHQYRADPSTFSQSALDNLCLEEMSSVTYAIPSYTQLYAELVNNSLTFANATAVVTPLDEFPSLGINTSLLLDCDTDCAAHEYANAEEDIRLTLIVGGVPPGNNNSVSSGTELLPHGLTIENPSINVRRLEIYFNYTSASEDDNHTLLDGREDYHLWNCFVAYGPAPSSYGLDSPGSDETFGCYVHVGGRSPVGVSVERQDLLSKGFLQRTGYWDDSTGAGVFDLSSLLVPSSAVGTRRWTKLLTVMGGTSFLMTIGNAILF